MFIRQGISRMPIQRLLAIGNLKVNSGVLKTLLKQNSGPKKLKGWDGIPMVGSSLEGFSGEKNEIATLFIFVILFFVCRVDTIE